MCLSSSLGVWRVNLQCAHSPVGRRGGRTPGPFDIPKRTPAPIWEQSDCRYYCVSLYVSASLSNRRDKGDSLLTLATAALPYPVLASMYLSNQALHEYRD